MTKPANQRAASPSIWRNLRCPGRMRRGVPVAQEPSEPMLCAKDHFDAAIRAMGCDLADIAWRVICAGEGVPLAKGAKQWSARSGKLVFRIALDRLAEFYRIPE